MKIEAFSTGGGGAPANYQQVSTAALRSATFNPGIEAAVASSRCTSRLVVGSIVNENPGAGPLSIWCQFRLPASLAANAGVCGLSPSETHILGGSGSDAIGLAVMSGDLQLVMGNSSTYTRYALGVASLVGQVVDVVVTRSGSTLAAYVNGTAVTLTPVNENGSVAPSATITATWAHALAPLSASITPASNASATGPVHRFVVFNRALSATDAASLIWMGIDVADQWGSHDALVSASTRNGGFETFSGGSFADWTNSSANATTINQDTAVFSQGAASLRFDHGAGNESRWVTSSLAIVPGRRYRLGFDFRHNATVARSPQYALGSSVVSNLTPAAAPNTWTSYSVEAVADGTTLQFFRVQQVGAGNSSWYDSVTLNRIGAFLDLQFDGTCGFQAADRANQLDATLFNGAGFILPDATQGFARWIAAAPAGERMGGSAGIVIPANCSISRIVVRNLNIGDSRAFSLGSSAGSLTDILSAVPINGNGSVNVLDPSSSISTTGQLWVSYTGTGSIKVSVFFNPA